MIFNKIRSLIFKIDPELAQDLAIKALKYNYIPLKKVEDNSTKIEIFGKKIPIPIGIAAGFDKDARVFEPSLRLGFGFVETGTVTPQPQRGNFRKILNVLFGSMKMNLLKCLGESYS